MAFNQAELYSWWFLNTCTLLDDFQLLYLMTFNLANSLFDDFQPS